jgi:NAD(P)-dependent dehydrogenase (short-subunit alcohol dehydrogenase family)
LEQWNTSTLDILINNAAQTLTDSVKKESRAVYQEEQSEADATETGLVFRSAGSLLYQPRVRGGVEPLALYGPVERRAIQAGQEPEATLILPEGVKDDGRTEIMPYFKSSWVQKLDEIPYEDVISAHAVNTFVPLILCREFLSIMGSSELSRDESSSRPLGYIINVSSREGIFELTPDHTAKRGKHVHTNMSKAALNMITQTEASPAWHSRRVAMNSVDPGYMSAAPEMDQLFDGQRPIGWEDGAARVLWPVAIGEVENNAVWGRFLKHYGATDVETQLTRS